MNNPSEDELVTQVRHTYNYTDRKLKTPPGPPTMYYTPKEPLRHIMEAVYRRILQAVDIEPADKSDTTSEVSNLSLALRSTALRDCGGGHC